MNRVFVSHSNEDNEWCRLFVQSLRGRGVDVWYDKSGLKGGDAWVRTLEQEIQSRQIFVVLLTPASWASKWVRKEVDLAQATGRTIIPVSLVPTKVDGFLLTIQWIRAEQTLPSSTAEQLVQLISTNSDSSRSPGFLEVRDGRNAGQRFDVTDDGLILFADHDGTTRVLAITSQNFSPLNAYLRIDKLRDHYQWQFGVANGKAILNQAGMTNRDFIFYRRKGQSSWESVGLSFLSDTDTLYTSTLPLEDGDSLLWRVVGRADITLDFHRHDT